MQFEERSFQTQLSVSADKLYEWNIDGLSEQEIINKISHMSMVGIAYQNNHDLDQLEIVNLKTPIIFAIPLLGWLCRLLGWFYSFAFTFTLTCITFNLYYCYITVLPHPTLCPLPPLWYQNLYFHQKQFLFHSLK